MCEDSKLRVSLAQYDIVWEDKTANLKKIESMMKSLSGMSDILVLPEMCTTGFSMNAQSLAEYQDGKTISLLKEWSRKYDVAVCGSFIAKEEAHFFNRAFFLSPSTEHYYDKHHLFRMGQETSIYSEGNKRLIFEHKGFHICLLVCYDLRFPVWARNQNNEYDLLIYIANWPKSRAKVWSTLLDARALENMTYVCGVNRVGRDGLNLDYSGNSKLIDAKGIEISSIDEGVEVVETIELSKKELDKFRAKFPAWKDADQFKINTEH